MRDSGLSCAKRKVGCVHAAEPPFWKVCGTESLIETDGLGVPIEHVPFETAGVTGGGQVSRCSNEGLAYALATKRRANEEILDEEAGLAAKRGEGFVVYR